MGSDRVNERKNMKTLRWLDLRLVAQTWEVNSAVMGFRLVQVEGWDDDDQENIVYSGATSSLDEAESFVDGDVKFDRCCNWQTQPGLMAHICEVEEIERLATAFNRLYADGEARGIIS